MVSFGQAFKEARKAGKQTFVWNGKTYTTLLRDEVEVPITLGVSGKTVGNTSREYIVSAPRTKITKDKRTQFQLVPFGDRLWKDYVTGLIYVTDNKGNIIGSTMSEEAAKEGRFLHYYGKLKLEAKRQAHIANAADELNKASARFGNSTLTTKQLQSDIRNARSTFTNTINGIVNTPNHIIGGGIRATISPNYTWNDYVQGIINPDINLQTIGVGDIAEVPNQFGRIVLNTVNPTSIFLSTGRSSLGDMKFENKNLLPGKLKVPNKGLSSFNTGVGKGRSHNRPIKLSNAGWQSDNKAVSTFSHVNGTGSHIENIPRGTIIVKTTPSNIVPIPTFYFRSLLEPNLPITPYVIDKGHVESPYITPWQRKWIQTGEMPSGGGTALGNARREGVFNTNDTYWINGEGKVYNSGLMNTYNYGQGFSTKR